MAFGFDFDTSTGVLDDWYKVGEYGTTPSKRIASDIATGAQKWLFEDEEEKKGILHPSGVDLKDQVDGVSMPAQKDGVLMTEADPNNPRGNTETPNTQQGQTEEAKPDTNSPVSTMNYMVQSRFNANDTNPPPELPTFTQVVGNQIASEGKQVVLSDIEDPDWYQDDSFYEGLMSFGLNLLSGRDWADSFNAGAKVFQDSKAREKREVWAKELIAQGYDAHEVQAWLETGDNKALTDPMEKAMKQQAFQLGQEQLATAIRENDPERIAYKDKMERWKAEQEYEDKLLDRESKAQSIAESKQRMYIAADEAKRKAAAATTAGTGDEDIPNTAEQRNLFLSGVLQSGYTFDDILENTYEIGNSDLAIGSLISKFAPEDMQDEAKKKHLPEYQAYKQMSNQISEMIGRGLSGGAISEAKERPTWANALVPTPAEKADPNQTAVNRKRAVYNSLKIYANTRAQGKRGNLTIEDVDLLAKGRLKIFVDPNTGVAKELRTMDGKIYKPL